MMGNAEIHKYGFDVIDLHRRSIRPDIRRENISLKDYFDVEKERFVDQMSLKIAGKKTSKTVTFHKTVEMSMLVPDGWFQHLLHDHPWLARALRREPRYAVIEETQTATGEQTVEFAALIPEMQIPEQARQGFDVYYTVL
jgi:hypothetical protein